MYKYIITFILKCEGPKIGKVKVFPLVRFSVEGRVVLGKDQPINRHNCIGTSWIDLDVHVKKAKKSYLYLSPRKGIKLDESSNCS